MIILIGIETKKIIVREAKGVQKQIIVLLEVVYLYFVFTSRQYSSHAHLSEDARFKSRPMSDSISLVKYLCVITNHIR